MKERVEGILLALLGVLIFSVTLPATRSAVPQLGPEFIGFGRGVVAGLIAIAVVLVTRDKIPERKYWKGLAIVALGVTIGFPLFSAFALRTLPSAHSAVVVGLLPAATAVMAVLLVGERPHLPFWIASGAGVVAVLLFAAVEGAGHPQFADLLLLIAVMGGAIGYAEGSRIAKEIGGFRVILWALVFCVPFLTVPMIAILATKGIPHGTPEAWLWFAYVAIASQFLGFLPWYRGLVLAGVAYTSQLGLIQPVLTLGWSVLILGERVSALTLAAALVVIGCAAATQWTRPHEAEMSPES
ncbi:MAG: DMT family transporter [Candidatus Eremiobacteraeota bacterium]|nr:DMT family transporter [Candidatus Eremiobacteraeota bacterium]MBV8365664.1 DMT family transporter [Candidatus Eremiobacteraeota bacterium]